MKRKSFLGLVFLSLTWQALPAQKVQQVDICIYGGSSAGVIAAYSARKLGKSVLLIEPGKHLGGLTSGGLGYTDIGNKYAISGLSLDYYRRLGKHYGRFEQWVFEPSVAEKTFQQYIQSAKVPVLFQYRLQAVRKEKDRIKEIVLVPSGAAGATSEEVVRAKMFIDCSYEGDLMAQAGVSYTTGREANAQYGETYNGVQLMKGHQFPDGIDPYKRPGDPSSGLLWGISPASLAAEGSGDKKIQAYNFRICLTNVPANRIPVTRPAGYDSTQYELLLRFVQQTQPANLKSLLKIDQMPNGKTDINNFGPFSTDMIGMNYDYPEGDPATRKKIIQAHEGYAKGQLYFIGHDPRMPAHLREQMQQWGYPKDEYVDNGHWSPQLYVRETRRMVGAYVMTQANCEGKVVVEDGVGMAAYTMDSHNCQRIVVQQGGKAMVKNEGNVEIGGFGPYPIAYRSLIPKAGECGNLLVPVCLSASHIAYGSIRMEPVFMVLAQSSAIAASLAIDQKVSVQALAVPAIQQVIKGNPLLDGSRPDILADDADTARTLISGNWKKLTRRSYGSSMLVSDSNSTAPAAVRFLPAVARTSEYAVYTYLPKVPGLADALQVTIHDGTKAHSKQLYTNTIQVVGQTSGEWVHLGDFRFTAGKQPYVEISNAAGPGMVVADAVLLQAR